VYTVQEETAWDFEGAKEFAEMFIEALDLKADENVLWFLYW